MDGRIDLSTLLFLALAVVLFVKLRSVLGRRTGDEETRYRRTPAPGRPEPVPGTPQPEGQDKIVTLPRRERAEAITETKPSEPQLEREARIKALMPANEAAATGLIAISRADAAFEPAQFVTGARAAYEMIVTAFAEGNRKILKDLLSREVYDGFATAITEREARAEKMDQSFVGIKSADILEAEIKDNVANLTLKFVSELISATRDKAGEVVAGDAKKIREVTDIWTFARDITSRNPNWRLVGTQAPN